MAEDHMSTGSVPGSRFASLVRWSIWVGSGATILLLVMGAVVWWLPRVAPILVAEHSPSFAYALEAVPHDSTNDALVHVMTRLSYWQDEPARVIRQRLEGSAPGADIAPDFEWLCNLCDKESLLHSAMQRLPPTQAEYEVERMLLRGRDDLLAANHWLLRHPDEEYRIIALKNLAVLGDASVRVKWESLLLGEEVWKRPWAADALRELGDPASVPALVAALSHADGRDHKRAWDALVTLAGPLSQEHVATLLGAPSMWVRFKTLELVEVGRARAPLPVLVRLVPVPFSHIAERTRLHLQASLTQDDLLLLVGYLRSDDAELQRGSLMMLLDRPDPCVVAPLLDLLVQSEGFIEPQVEQLLLTNLPADDDRALLDGLAQRSATARVWVARQLGRRRLAGSAAALLKRELDPEPHVRAAIYRALGMMQAVEAIPWWEHALKSDNVEERVAAIRAFGDLGDPQHLPRVQPYLNALEYRERQASAVALGQLGQRGDVALCAALRPLLQDAEWSVQEAARASLERVSGDADEVRALERQRVEEFSAPAAAIDPQ